MMRSLNSGVSGLRIHQTKMDVIGNNIANVNTVGFKSSSTIFSDIFYQTTQAATGHNAETGSAGRNAMQIGLGSSISTIKMAITNPGGAQRTDAMFDLMISGDSFFVVNNAGVNYFTKAGSFGIDGAGYLATPTGALVMGWLPDPANPNRTIQDNVKPLQIQSPENLFATPEATTKTHVTGNIDRNDPQIAPGSTGKVIQMSFYDNMGNSYNANFKAIQSADANNMYDLVLDDVVDSNGKSIFSLLTGAAPATSVYSKVTFGGVEYTPAYDAATGKTSFTPVTGHPRVAFDGATGAYKTVGTGDLNAANVAISKSLEFAIDGTPNPFKAIDVDFSKTTMYATSGSTNLEAVRGDTEERLGAGRPVGKMTGVDIDQSGKIYGKYDNGVRRLLGQLASTSFANPAGLESVGNSMFAQTQNSGEFDGVGKDITATGGTFNQGMLEMSNVDLSAQFTDMIVTQRGFQANSRIITTSDTLLEELINLKR